MSNLRWKLVTIIVVTVVFAAVGVYPIVAARWGLTGPKVLTERQLKLGLDLKGGVNLVLRVQTDDALRIEAETEMERLRELLSTARINTTNIAIAGTNAFKVEGVSPDQDSAFRTSANEVSANFDRDSGVNGTYTFTLKPNIATQLRDRKLKHLAPSEVDAVVSANTTVAVCLAASMR